jgi:hypothetical protein
MHTTTIDTTVAGTMPLVAPAVLPQNERYLRDAFGAPLRDGSCVVDADRTVGYVRLEFGSRRGPDSAYWDGWFSVTTTRGAHPLSGKVANGTMVQLIGVGSHTDDRPRRDGHVR